MALMLRNFVSGLSDRERRLMLLMGIVAIVLFFFIGIYLVRSAINDLTIDNEKAEDTLKLVLDKKDEYKALKREMEISGKRGLSKPTPLRTLIDKISKDLDVVVPDIKELPDQRHGTKWTVHSAELSLRGVELRVLKEFMEKAESHGNKFPIAITKLEIRKRRREEAQYDVKMIISTYEQSASPEGMAPAKGGKGGRS